ncbi:MAG: sensor histidine kinase [Bacteroidales bacterium]|nr:sensor histidine kinase [Bacteroidales bacterium]
MNQKKTHTNKSAFLGLFLSILTVHIFFFNTDIKSQDNILGLPNDSIKVMKIFDLAWSLEIKNPDSAIKLYEMGTEISNQINYPIGFGRGLQYKGIVLSDQGRYDTAIEYYQKAIEVFKTIPYQIGVAATYVNIGNVFQFKANYAQAVENYLVGIKLFEQLNDTTRLIMAYNNIGGIFSDVEQFDKSLQYYQISLELSYLIDDSTNVGYCYYDIAVVELKKNNLTLASDNLDKALISARSSNDLYLLSLIHLSFSEIDTKNNHHLEALKKSKLSLSYANILGNPEVTSTILARLGYNYKNLAQLDSADYYLNQSIRIAKKNQALEVLLFAYQWMAELQELKKNYKSAIEWQRQYKILQDSASGQRQMRIISGLDIQYETEKKDLELSEKTLTIERNKALLSKRNYFIIALSGALISAFVFLFLYRQSQRQKRIIAQKNATVQQEKLKQLKKEKQVIALKSMMEGQEHERSRMAKDLHDGLGGLLSSVKLHFNNIRIENKKLQQSADFQKALELLDTTSSEARKISHNLMPEALKKFGLIDALRDFCSNISNSGALNIDFQSYNINERLTEAKEIMIYRIVQELVNNIVKHAKASKAIVQLMCNDKMLYLTVEDNGRGFDPKKIKKNSAGMSNIRSRVDFLNGNLDIDSSPEKGTTVSINIQM